MSPGKTTFHYTALKADNSPVSGTLEAESENAALEELKKRGWHSIQVTQLDATGSPDSTSSRSEVMFDDELVASLETITGAGLPLESSLRLLAESHPSSRVSHTLRQLSNRLSRGESWEQIAAGKHSSLPPVYEDLFHLQLAPGQMSEVLNRYQHYARQTSETRWRIWAGMFYSLVILVTLILMVGYLLIALVPQFKQIFEGFDTELPFATIGLINLSDFASGPGWIAFVSVVFAVILLWVFGGASVRRIMQQFTRFIPVSGRAFEGASLSSFCHLLAELIQRQVPLSVSLKLAADGSKDLTLQHDCRKLAERVHTGEPLTESVFLRMHFRPEVVNAFRWSSQPAQFVDALHATGAAFEGQARTRAGLIPIVLEPFILFLVLAIVMTFAGALFLPLIKLLNDLS